MLLGWLVWCGLRLRAATCILVSPCRAFAGSSVVVVFARNKLPGRSRESWTPSKEGKGCELNALEELASFVAGETPLARSFLFEENPAGRGKKVLCALYLACWLARLASLAS